jgi:hypothetical protein
MRIEKQHWIAAPGDNGLIASHIERLWTGSNHQRVLLLDFSYLQFFNQKHADVLPERERSNGEPRRLWINRFEFTRILKWVLVKFMTREKYG